MSQRLNIETVTTLALLVDGRLLSDNIVQMAARAEAIGVELWPHSKTHKSRRIARLQHDHGASGLTVATVREAECFADAGFENLLLAYPPVGGWRLDRLLKLADSVNVRVVLDSIDTVAMLDDACRRSRIAVRYLWEIDCGVGRCGTKAGSTTAALIERAMNDFSRATFDGLMTFGGHACAAADDDGIAAEPSDIPLRARLRVIPNHSCATANLHATMLLLEGEQVADVWSVDARGWDGSPAGSEASQVGMVSEAP